MNDVQSFMRELMVFLTKDDIRELNEKAGVRFPLSDLHWSDLCYICCWMGMKRELPDSLHNRMIIGEANDWSRLYISVLERRRSGSSSSMSVEELFSLAS